MKRIYSFTVILSMLVLAWGATGCSKTAAGPEAATANEITGYAIYSPDSLRVGSVSITRAGGGEARVSISMEKAYLSGKEGPFRAQLQNSEPLAYLNPVDAHTGISETSPVMAASKNLTVSYDALMFTRDLSLWISDGDHRLIGSSKLR